MQMRLSIIKDNDLLFYRARNIFGLKF